MPGIYSVVYIVHSTCRIKSVHRICTESNSWYSLVVVACSENRRLEPKPRKKVGCQQHGIPLAPEPPTVVCTLF